MSLITLQHRYYHLPSDAIKNDENDLAERYNVEQVNTKI